MSGLNSRKFRLLAKKGRLSECRTGVEGAEVKGRFFHGKAGAFRHITVNEDGSTTIGKKAFVDDAVAFLSGAIATNPTIDDEIKKHLVDFVNAMDARAVKRHGYNGSLEEKEVEWED